MTTISLSSCNESEQRAVRGQLDRILKSGPFHQSRHRQRFLEYIVNEALAGRGERLKGYSIALAVFDRPETFDPAADPIVRIEATRLRAKLREYYEGEGQSDTVRIDLPKGGYAPHIEFKEGLESDGLQSDDADSTTASEPTVREMPSRPLAAAIIALLLVIVAGLGVWMRWGPSTPSSGKASIAVLPFVNIGNDPKWERFTGGITEDIVTDLSHSKDLFVIAHNSTEVYRRKPADVRTVGRDLGVRYVLEGGIQPSGDKILVTARLIDAKTGGNVWSNNYDRPATDLFQVQSDIAEKIVATLTGYQGAIASAERLVAHRKPPRSLTAYELYLLGIEAQHGATKEGIAEGERLFRKALEIDPQLARAYVGLAYTYEYHLELGLGVPAESRAKFMDAARNAVRLDPTDSETRLALGGAFAYQGMADQALEQFAKVELLAPGNADSLITIAWYLLQVGQIDRAVGLVEKALLLNPNYPPWYNQIMRSVYFFDHKFDKAVKHGKLVTDPFAVDFAFLAAASARSGDMKGARAAAAEVIRLDPHWTVEEYSSDRWHFPEDAAKLLVEAAREAGVPACVSADRLSFLPKLIHMKMCDEMRTQVDG